MQTIFVAEEQDALSEKSKAASIEKSTATDTHTRKVPKCKKCGQPRKGHPRNTCPIEQH